MYRKIDKIDNWISESVCKSIFNNVKYLSYLEILDFRGIKEYNENSL